MSICRTKSVYALLNHANKTPNPGSLQYFEYSWRYVNTHQNYLKCFHSVARVHISVNQELVAIQRLKFSIERGARVKHAIELSEVLDHGFHQASLKEGWPWKFLRGSYFTYEQPVVPLTSLSYCRYTCFSYLSTWPGWNMIFVSKAGVCLRFCL